MSKVYSDIKGLSRRYATISGVTLEESEARVKDFLSAMKQELLDKNLSGLKIVNFLMLKKISRKAKVGRNPKVPDKTYEIPEQIAIKCELGKEFKEELNKKEKAKKNKDVKKAKKLVTLKK